MGWPETDLEYMRTAIGQAALAADAGEIPVGAAVAYGGEVIATGHNRSITDQDPSAHAEIVALRAAAARRGNYRLAGATLYVTLEPCVMCMGAIAEARISRLVFGAYDPKSGAAGSAIDLSDVPAIHHRFEINGGVLAQECGEMLRKFFEARR